MKLPLEANLADFNHANRIIQFFYLKNRFRSLSSPISRPATDCVATNAAIHQAPENRAIVYRHGRFAFRDHHKLWTGESSPVHPVHPAVHRFAVHLSNQTAKVSCPAGQWSFHLKIGKRTCFP